LSECTISGFKFIFQSFILLDCTISGFKFIYQHFVFSDCTISDFKFIYQTFILSECTILGFKFIYQSFILLDCTISCFKFIYHSLILLYCVQYQVLDVFICPSFCLNVLRNFYKFFAFHWHINKFAIEKYFCVCYFLEFSQIVNPIYFMYSFNYIIAYHTNGDYIYIYIYIYI
jgi:hypothetical protein